MAKEQQLCWRRGLLGALAGAGIGFVAFLLDASPWWWLAVLIGLSLGGASFRVEASVRWSAMRQPAATYTEADLERIIARDFALESIPEVKTPWRRRRRRSKPTGSSSSRG